MEIIERKIAAEYGLKTYYTGKPCKHGHVTYRYTQSGTCQECVNGSLKPREVIDNASYLAQKAARTERAMLDQAQREAVRLDVVAKTAAEKERDRLGAIAAKALTPVNLIVPDGDWQAMEAFALCVAQGALPDLRESDVIPGKPRRESVGGCGRYTVNAPANLHEELRMFEQGLRAAQEAASIPRKFATTPGALYREAFAEAPQEVATDHKEGRVQKRGGRWYRFDDLSEIKSVMPFITPLPEGFFPKGRPVLTRGEAIRITGWNGAVMEFLAELNQTGGDYPGALCYLQLDGDWYSVPDLAALLKERAVSTIKPCDPLR